MTTLLARVGFFDSPIRQLTERTMRVPDLRWPKPHSLPNLLQECRIRPRMLRKTLRFAQGMGRCQIRPTLWAGHINDHFTRRCQSGGDGRPPHYGLSIATKLSR